MRCPITQELMEDPVIARDDFSYDRQAIAEWFDDRDTSPMTNKRIAKDLVPNRALRADLFSRFQKN